MFTFSVNGDFNARKTNLRLVSEMRIFANLVALKNGSGFMSSVEKDVQRIVEMIDLSLSNQLTFFSTCVTNWQQNTYTKYLSLN